MTRRKSICGVDGEGEPDEVHFDRGQWPARSLGDLFKLSIKRLVVEFTDPVERRLDFPSERPVTSKVKTKGRARVAGR